MKYYAVIFAGGTGQRMNIHTKPKQFLELHGKPILVYTLEAFEKCKSIEGIVLVMLSDWIPYSNELIQKCGLRKVTAIVPGGFTGQESIFNGLSKVKEITSVNCGVLIHDGVRPIIDTETIEKCIASLKKYGNAITVSPAIETVVLNSEDETVGKILPRNKCLMAKAPQCFFLDDIYEAHLKARSEKRRDFIDSASLMQFYGYKLYTVEGKSENIKITTPTDFYIFKALIDAKEDSQIFG